MMSTRVRACPPSDRPERYRVRRFELGRSFLASAARDAKLPGRVVLECFRRHARGDFGDISPIAFEANLDAIVDGGPISSEYRYGQFRISVTTEATRSLTILDICEY